MDRVMLKKKAKGLIRKNLNVFAVFALILFLCNLIIGIGNYANIIANIYNTAGYGYIANINYFSLPFFKFFSFAISFLLIPMLMFSIQNASLQVARDKEIKYSMLKYGFNRLFDSVILNLLRTLFVFLWSLLLVVPGILKSYSYRMAPYLMIDDKNLTPREAIKLSTRIMDGHRFELFVLDISFIGWYILWWITAGVFSLYVLPYRQTSEALFYLNLKSSEEAL